MPLPRLYYEKSLKEGQCLELDTKASQYLLHVLRLKKNSPLLLFNGQGGEFTATIIDIKKRTATIELIKYQPGLAKPSLNIHLGQGLAKGQRMDYALQKATELGGSTITPLYTKRNNVQLSPSRLENRMQHWRGVITHAAAQSKRCEVPVLNTPAHFSESTLLKEKNTLKLICSLRETDHIFSTTENHTPSKVILLIGPEGGFTPEEIDIALNNGFEILNLGPRTLRTETATVTALSLIQMLWGDIKFN